MIRTKERGKRRAGALCLQSSTYISFSTRCACVRENFMSSTFSSEAVVRNVKSRHKIPPLPKTPGRCWNKKSVLSAVPSCPVARGIVWRWSIAVVNKSLQFLLNLLDSQLLRFSPFCCCWICGRLEVLLDSRAPLEGAGPDPAVETRPRGMGCLVDCCCGI